MSVLDSHLISCVFSLLPVVSFLSSRMYWCAIHPECLLLSICIQSVAVGTFLKADVGEYTGKEIAMSYSVGWTESVRSRRSYHDF